MLEFEGNKISMRIQYEQLWLVIDLIGVLAGNFYWSTDGEEGRSGGISVQSEMK